MANSLAIVEHLGMQTTGHKLTSPYRTGRGNGSSERTLEKSGKAVPPNHSTAGSRGFSA